MQIGGASTHATTNGGKDDGAVRRVEENEKVEGEKGKPMERLVERDSSEKDDGIIISISMILYGIIFLNTRNMQNNLAQKVSI